MNAQEFNQVKKLCTTYMSTLNLKEIKKELSQKGLLTTNMKLSKGEMDNYGLELLPSILSGKNICPNAGSCRLSCIAFTGIGNMIKSKTFVTELNDVLKMKARKTFLFLNDKECFIELLKSEINHRNTMSKIIGKKAFFRLNVTSDIDWRFLTDELSNISFYDYTKVWNRSSTFNYDLTFSASEHTTEQMITEKVESGENVAVVFNNTKKMVKKFLNFDVIDGDKTDNRYLDNKGFIIGLRYKNPAMGGKNDAMIFGN